MVLTFARVAAFPGRTARAAGRRAGSCRACLIAFSLAGCATLTPDPPAPGVVSALPEAYGQAGAKGAYRPVKWWRSYDDPVLDYVVGTAVARNVELRQAIARVEQVRARYRIERADLFPQLGAEGSVSYQEQPANTGLGSVFGGGGDGEAPPGGAPGDPPDRFNFTVYEAALRFSYELDFWGRIRNQSRSAFASYEASVADLQTASLSVVTETIRAYFDLIETERLLDLLGRQQRLLRDRVAVGEAQYLRGLAGSFELIALRERLRELDAQIPGLRAQIFAAKSRLAVLLGTYPPEIDAMLAKRGPLTVAVAAAPIPPGLPSALLLQRPDVRAARRRLDAARFDVGAARAALFPQFSLTGRGGLQAGSPAGLFDLSNWFTNLIGSLTAPIFAGGRLRGQVALSEAQLEERAWGYGQAVLTAFGEVETALNRHRRAIERLDALKADLGTAQAAADLQLRRFARGTVRYGDVLDAERNLLDSRRAFVQAQRAVAEARLSVHRALGGAWVENWLVEPVGRGG